MREVIAKLLSKCLFWVLSPVIRYRGGGLDTIMRYSLRHTYRDGDCLELIVRWHPAINEEESGRWVSVKCNHVVGIYEKDVDHE